MTEPTRPRPVTLFDYQSWAKRKGIDISKIDDETLEKVLEIGNQIVQKDFDEREARREEARRVSK